MHKIDAIDDASSIVIFPDGSGVSSDINRRILGLVQPHVQPYDNVSKFTIKDIERNEKLTQIHHISFMFTNKCGKILKPST